MAEQASARIDGCKLWVSVQLAWGNQPVSAGPRDLGTGTLPRVRAWCLSPYGPYTAAKFILQRNSSLTHTSSQAGCSPN
jgi:hypothetical protein